MCSKMAIPLHVPQQALKAMGIAALVVLPLFFGCETVHSLAVGTPYEPYNALRGGYSETALATDVVRVVFRGNSSTSKERAQDLALLRAADLSRQAGFKFFTVLYEENGGAVAGDQEIVTPKCEIRVQFLNEKAPGAVVFDDAFISATMRKKYEVP